MQHAAVTVNQNQRLSCVQARSQPTGSLTHMVRHMGRMMSSAAGWIGTPTPSPSARTGKTLEEHSRSQGRCRERPSFQPSVSRMLSWWSTLGSRSCSMDLPKGLLVWPKRRQSGFHQVTKVAPNAVFGHVKVQRKTLIQKPFCVFHSGLFEEDSGTLWLVCAHAFYHAALWTVCHLSRASRVSLSHA